jgi:EAL domain-containing protein (putative c-di-GMP-specific phosphodiesterase class I)
MLDIQTAHGFRTHISEKRYSVMGQPVVCAQTNEILHHEWLVRFDSPTGIDQVLRPAEISGAISDLDLSMLGQAIETLNKNPKRKPIAINLSGASFSEPAFERALLFALTNLNAGPEKLIFELTETWHMKDLQPVIRLLNILRDRGHSLCLDDVGAGAASIRYLRALPADWLKIDGGFVAGAANSSQERAVLKAVMSLRHDLDVRFIAEGIESAPLHEFATSMGFDALQGFVIGAPELEISS